MDKIPIRIIRKKSFKNRVLSFVNFSLFKNVFSGILVGLVFAGLFSAGFFVLATANYYPGQTTTPTCSPTDPDCTVTPSAVYSFTSNNFSGTGDFTTTGTVKAGTLGVGTNYTFPTSAGSANKFLGYDGAGTFGWQTVTSTDISGLVPYTGANATVNLGSQALTTSGSGTFSGASGIILGTQTTTNIPGTAKFLAAGSNSAFYTTITAGTNTGNTTITLPTANPAGTYLLNMTSGGVMGYDSTAYLTSSTGLLATGATTGATSQAQVFTNGVTLSNITSGSMLFAGTAGVVSQNNNSFSWDNGTQQLAIGYNPSGVNYPDQNMTANNAPSPYVASASSEWNSSYAAWKAFDNNSATGWLTTTTGWLKIDLGTNRTIQVYKLQEVEDVTRMAKDWTLDGSTNNIDWTTGLDTQTNAPAWGVNEIRTYNIDPSKVGSYRYYRINVTANKGNDTYLEIGGFTLLNVSATHPTVTSKLYLYTASASNKGLIVQGASGQTANLAEFQNSAGTVLSSINANGSLTLPAGTATAGTAPLYFTSGTSLTSAVAGAMEYDGTNFYFSPSTTRYMIPLSTGTAANTLLFTTTGSTTLTLPTSGTLVNSAVATLSSLTSTGTITTGGLGTGATLGAVTMNIASSAVGDIYYAGASNVLTRLADVAVGSYLRSGGTTTAPLWSTLILPNAGTAYKLAAYTATNTLGELSAVGATGEYLAGATGAIPAWATLNQAAVAGLTTSDTPSFAALTATGATGLTLGTQTTTNIPGTAKFLAAGSNSAYYTTLTAGTNTGNTTITLPTANPAGTYLLNMTSSGVLGYDSTTYLTSSTGLLATGSTTGATAISQTFTNGVTLSNISAGSMLFAGTAGLVSQNYYNLFWDDTNKRIALGYVVPTSFTYTKISPTMTANDAPSPYVVSASSELSSSYAAWKAFDNDAATFWKGANALDWLKIDFGTATTTNSYRITDRTASGGGRPKSWTFEGSATGAFAGEQTALDIQTSVPDWSDGEVRTYSYNQVTSGTFRYYRFNITANWSAAQMAIFEFSVGNSTIVYPAPAPLAKLQINTVLTTEKGLIIQGASGQTANLAEFQNSAGTVLSSINANGSLTLPAGTATAGTAPLYFTSGTSLTSAVAGAMEYDGTNFYFSPSTTRYMIPLSTGTAANTLLFTTTGSTTLTLPTSGTLVNSAVATLSSLTSTGTITTGGLGTGATLGSVTMNIASSAVGDIYYAGASNILTRLADVAVGSYLRSGGTTTAPLWSTLVLPNSGTAYKLAAYTATNTLGELAAVGATGEYLAGATGAIPSWATLNQAAVAGLTTASSPTFAGLTDSAMSSGSMLFAGAGGVVSQNLTNLSWDNTNARLAIGYNASNLLISPTMTSYTAPSPYVASTTDGSNVPGWSAIDNDLSTAWSTGVFTNGTTIEWLSLDYNTAKIITSYSLGAHSGSKYANMPLSWTFQGSTDNSNWTTLDTQTDVSAWTISLVRTYTPTLTGSYRYYRLYVTKVQTNTDRLWLAEWKMYSGVAAFNPLAKLHINTTLTTEKALILQGASAQTANLVEFQNSAGTVLSSINANGSLTLPAGTATAGTAPLYFTSGTSLTSAVAGAMEFTTDDLFFTITTGTARKRLLMADAVGGLTSGRVPYVTTNGRLTDTSGLSFNGTILTAPNIIDSGLTSGRITYATTSGQLTDNANLTFDGTNLQVAGAGDSQIISSNGALVLGSSKAAGFLGSLKIDFEAATGTATFTDGALAGSTAVTKLDFGTLNLSTGGYILGSPIVTLSVSGVPTSPTTAGALIVDSADGRLYTYYSSGWHYIAVTAGFQIPDYETKDPISGDQMKEGDIVMGQVDQTMSDGALHGVWVKWDSVKAQMLAELKTELQKDGTLSGGTVGSINLDNPFVVEIKNILAYFGLKVDTGGIDVARIKKIEMVDSATGDIYCTWVENGEWQKVKGACDAQAPPAETPAPPADQPPADNTPAPPAETPAPVVEPTPDVDPVPVVEPSPDATPPDTASDTPAN